MSPVRTQVLLAVLFVFIPLMPLMQGCQPQAQSIAAAAAAAAAVSNTTTTTPIVTTTEIPAIQIITKAESTTGSFDSVVVPASGGISLKAQRIFNLDGSTIPTGSYPTWFSEARVFLTSTRTSGANPVSPSGSDTPCAYFDGFVDNNPDNNNYFTIDGFNANLVGADADQCAGTNAAELNQLSIYVKVDRRFMSASEKLQVIVKAKIIDEPNTAPTASSCVSGGFFDATSCSNQLFTVTMRTAPGAAAKPFFHLFPSAKALDLLSESILLPININSGVTTISIDRVKGGAVFYGITVIRL